MDARSPDGEPALEGGTLVAPVASRTITPALALEWVADIPVTRAVITTSPLTASEAKRNSSVVPQMSAPLPITVHVLPDMIAEPETATVPMSAVLQPGGSVAAALAVTTKLSAALAPDGSLAVTVTVADSAALGVPLKVRVEGLNASQAGNPLAP